MDAYLQLRSVIHMFRVLNNLVVRQVLKGLLPGQAHHLPERHGEGPDAARAGVPVLKSKNRHVIAFHLLSLKLQPQVDPKTIIDYTLGNTEQSETIAGSYQ